MNVSFEEQFYCNVCDLCDYIIELIEGCWSNGYKIISPAQIKIAKNLLLIYDKSQLINNFIIQTNDYWDNIRTRDYMFFIENGNKLLGESFRKDINIFELIFTAKNPETGAPLILDDEKENLWVYFSSLVKISISYIHKKRNCILIKKDNGMEPKYQTEFMPDIKVRKQAKLWEVTLDLLNTTV